MPNMSPNKVKMPEQDPNVRNKNFEEVSLGYTKEQAMEEATRCLNCKKPFCMDGCPVGVPIPEFIHHVAEGEFEEAYQTITRENALPAICGRVCPQENQCEGKCVRGIKTESVGIGRLERFVADYHREHGKPAELKIEKNGKKVAVIGGGNSALEEAMYLATLCKKVHLIVRRDVFRADKIIQDRLLKSENIEVHFKRKPAEILEEDNKVKGLVLENSETGEKEELMVNGIFPFIGLDPMTQCAKSLGIVNSAGYIDANENMETAVKGIFVAGDVRNKQLRQVVTATNDGAIAGQYIASLK